MVKGFLCVACPFILILAESCKSKVLLKGGWAVGPGRLWQGLCLLRSHSVGVGTSEQVSWEKQKVDQMVE